MAKRKNDGRRWFDVTIKESYHHTYKVWAMDEQEADDLANDAVNNSLIDPTEDGAQTYDRETDVEPSTSKPKNGDRKIYPEEED